MKLDVVVIGAGIIGLATAERLLTHGANVTILERNHAGQESSWAGGGILSPLLPWKYSDHVTQLTNYSAKQFPAWISSLREVSGIDPEYEISGMFVLELNNPPFLIFFLPETTQTLIERSHMTVLYFCPILLKCVTPDYYAH